MKKTSLIIWFVIFLCSGPAFSDGIPMTPGTLRLSEELRLDGVFHKVADGWTEAGDRLNKVYSREPSKKNSWEDQWGESLLTDVAARITPDFDARVLFELQGDYADRFWRPINANHRADSKDQNLIFREAEGKIKKENWYVDAFSGVPRPDWRAHGDFFQFYPQTYFNEDYLGSSGYYGVYPKSWNQNVFLNINGARVPQGVELGGSLNGLDAAFVTGNQLDWGFPTSYFGRVSYPLESTKISVVAKNTAAPFADDPEETRDKAASLTWEAPFGSGNKFQAGAMYRPYRSGENYQIVRKVAAGSGLLGSSFSFSEKTAHNNDGLGGRLRLEMQPEMFKRLWFYAIDLTHLGILAGNRNQIDLEAGTHVTPNIKSDVKYTYRKPVEGPIPFLFEGSPNNIGAVAANPRGPESPFNVDWTNREAVFLLATVQINSDKDTTMFQYDQQTLGRWNLFKDVPKKPFSLAVQYRMSDYKTTTDRQYYWDENGNIVWEPAGHTGAWPSKHPLNEFRVMGVGTLHAVGYFLGIAGGESPALSGLAYSNDPTQGNKAITGYYSFEAEISYYPIAFRGNYGSGVWGPEPNIHPFFGNSFDRLWGVGLSYNITANTVWDLDYLSARETDNLFVPPDLGSYDEIRTTFSHRFGFEFQFQEM